MADDKIGEVKENYAMGDHKNAKPKIVCTCCPPSPSSSKTLDTNDPLQEMVSVGKIVDEIRLTVFIDLAMFFLRQGCELFGGFPRDWIRLQAGIEDRYAFNDIDVIIPSTTWNDFLQRIDQFHEWFSDDLRFQSISYIKMPGRTSYCGYTTTIIGKAGFRDLTFEIKIDFVRKIIDTVLDFDIGSLSMSGPESFKIRPCKINYDLKFGQVMKNILESKFEIIGLDKDASFDPIKPVNETGYTLKQMYTLIRMIKMIMRITKKIDQEWSVDEPCLIGEEWTVSSLPEKIFDRIRMAKRQCLGCTKIPDQCAWCGETGEAIDGKWCYVVECCHKLITIDCLYGLVAEIITQMQTDETIRGSNITIECIYCKKKNGLF